MTAWVVDQDLLLERFIALFDGNETAIGTEEGGCLRSITEQDWANHMRDHLTGASPPIGVYPMVSNEVKWGCVDFDEGDEESLVHARNLQNILFAVGITSWIERSRSKGYHVWVFATEWVDAVTMRHALWWAADTVGAPTREVNPKQTELLDGQLGNYVRLPYPGMLSLSSVSWMERRAVIKFFEDVAHVGPIFSLTAWAFINAAYESTVDHLTLASVAARYSAPVKKAPARSPFQDSPTFSNTDSHTRLTGLAHTMLEGGTYKIDGDRSDHLYKLARQIREDGTHSFLETVALVTECDARMEGTHPKGAKFAPRVDGAQRIHELVEKAW